MSTAWDAAWAPAWDATRDATAIIDLDLVASPDADDATPEHGWLRSVRSRIAVLGCALLFVLAGSSPTPAPPFPQVVRIPVGDGASLVVHAGRAFVLEIDGRRNVLRSYPLDGRGRTWTVAVAEFPNDGVMWASGDTVIVSMNAEQVTGVVHTEAFDISTGRRLWYSPFGVVGVADHGDVLLESKVMFPMAGLPDTPTAPAGWTFERVSAHTGRSRWTSGVPLNCDQQLVQDPAHGMPDGLVELCSDAPVLRIVDLSTGKQRAARDISTAGKLPTFTFPPKNAPMAPQAMVYGDVVVVAHIRNRAATLDAFDAANLQQAWPGIEFAPWQTVADCEPYLCLLSNTEPTVIDPQTGRELASVAAADAIAPRRAQTMIAADGPQGTRGTFRPVIAVADGVAEAVPSPDSGSAWITDSATGADTASPVEKLTGVGVTACLQLADYLACSPTLDSLTIWRLR